MRSEKLAAITGGKAEWYDTHKAIVTAERTAGVEWDGTAGEYRPARPGALVRSKRGTWARRQHGTGRVGALTRDECRAAGLEPGPGND